MTTRTFQAETIMEALQKVQEEMGPDAVVVSARDIPMGPAWQVWKRPGVEVISISPDEVEKAHGLTNKSGQPARVIRPSRNGEGIEFVEEKPSIEWDGNPVADGTDESNAPAEDELPLHYVKSFWKPRYLRKEEVQAMNQLLANHPAQPEIEKAQRGVILQPEHRSAPQKIRRPGVDGFPQGMRRFREKLSRQGLDAEYLDQLDNLILKGCTPAVLEDDRKIRTFLVNSLAANLNIRRWPNTEVPSRVLVFVGLTGSGKTASLSKVAVFYHSLLGKKVVWVCADTVRTGAVSEAKTYTQAANIPLELAYTPAELRAAVQKHADADLILVDTPGYNPSLEEQEVELGSFLVELPEAQILLVTSATAKESDSLYCYDTLKVFGLKGSVLSKMDETATYGSLYNFSRKSHLPLTFFTSSRKASTGLKIADADLLVEAMLNRGW